MANDLERTGNEKYRRPAKGRYADSEDGKRVCVDGDTLTKDVGVGSFITINK